MRPGLCRRMAAAAGNGVLASAYLRPEWELERLVQSGGECIFPSRPVRFRHRVLCPTGVPPGASRPVAEGATLLAPDGDAIGLALPVAARRSDRPGSSKQSSCNGSKKTPPYPYILLGISLSGQGCGQHSVRESPQTGELDVVS